MKARCTFTACMQQDRDELVQIPGMRGAGKQMCQGASNVPLALTCKGLA